MASKTSRVAEHTDWNPGVPEDLDRDLPATEDLDLPECISPLAYSKSDVIGPMDSPRRVRNLLDICGLAIDRLPLRPGRAIASVYRRRRRILSLRINSIPIQPNWMARHFPNLPILY